MDGLIDTPKKPMEMTEQTSVSNLWLNEQVQLWRQKQS